MKLKGKKLEPPKPVDIVLPRKDEVIRLKAQAVFSYDEFDKLCPTPELPSIIEPGKKPRPITEKDKDAWAEHERDLNSWWHKRRGWLYIKSLSCTPDLEWEQISLNDPNTWTFRNFVAELKASGFTDNEIGHIIQEVDRANALDEKHIEEVRERFLSEEARSAQSD
jgi:hypothetical protein